MNFEIVVTHGGTHFFATAERSILSESTARLLYIAIKSKFPENEGFDVKCYRVMKSFDDITSRLIDL